MGRNNQGKDLPGEHSQGADLSPAASTLLWLHSPTRQTQHWPLGSHQECPIPYSALGWVLGALSSEGQGGWTLLLDPILPSTVGYDRNNKQHHRLLLCLLMTSCDLSDQTKGWKTTRKIAVGAVLPGKA